MRDESFEKQNRSQNIRSHCIVKIKNTQKLKLWAEDHCEQQAKKCRDESGIRTRARRPVP